jgi:hypothetical protein
LLLSIWLLVAVVVVELTAVAVVVLVVLELVSTLEYLLVIL